MRQSTPQTAALFLQTPQAQQTRPRSTNCLHPRLLAVRPLHQSIRPPQR